MAVCGRYVDIALGLADFSEVKVSTIKTVIFLIAGKLDFHAINPHAPQPT